MISKLIPDAYYHSIEEIPYTTLYDHQIRLILTDLDNTLISYRKTEPTEELFRWKNQLIQMGFEIILVSNSRKKRVEHFAKLLDIPFVKFAKKPLKFGLKKAIKSASFKVSKEEILVLGDQLMTDVFAAKRMNLKVFLIQAIDSKTEVWTTRMNRKLEMHFLKKIRKKYPKLYEERLKEYAEGPHDRTEM